MRRSRTERHANCMTYTPQTRLDYYSVLVRGSNGLDRRWYGQELLDLALTLGLTSVADRLNRLGREGSLYSDEDVDVLSAAYADIYVAIRDLITSGG